MRPNPALDRTARQRGCRVPRGFAARRPLKTGVRAQIDDTLPLQFQYRSLASSYQRSSAASVTATNSISAHENQQVVQAFGVPLLDATQALYRARPGDHCGRPIPADGPEMDRLALVGDR